MSTSSEQGQRSAKFDNGRLVLQLNDPVIDTGQRAAELRPIIALPPCDL